MGTLKGVSKLGKKNLAPLPTTGLFNPKFGSKTPVQEDPRFRGPSPVKKPLELDPRVIGHSPVQNPYRGVSGMTPQDVAGPPNLIPTVRDLGASVLGKLTAGVGSHVNDLTPVGGGATGGSAATRGSSSSSGSGSAASLTPTEVPPPFTIDDLLAKLKLSTYEPQPLVDMYGALTVGLKNSQQSAAAYDQQQQDAIKQMYGSTNDAIAARLAQEKTQLGDSAAGLGVDLTGSNLANQIQQHDVEAAAARQAMIDADNSYFTKMKANHSDVYDNLINSAQLSGINHEADLKNMIDTSNAAITSDADKQFTAYQLALQQAAQAALSGGGGGGSSFRRHSGGGSSSGGGNVYDTTTATETQNLNNVGDEQIYQALLQNNPEAAAAYRRIENLSSGNPGTFLANAQKAYDDAAAGYDRLGRTVTSSKPTLLNLINLPKSVHGVLGAQKNTDLYNAVLGAAELTGGFLGNPRISASTSTKGSQRTYLPNTPFKTTASTPAQKKAPPKSAVTARLFK